MFFNIILDELVTEFELKVRERGWIILFNRRGGVCGCLICVSFVLQDPSLIYQIGVLLLRFQWLSTTNVNWRRSCWDSVSIYSRVIMSSYADATLVGELLSISVYTVYMFAHDGNNLTHFMTTATLIIYIADVTLSQENEILQIHSVLASSGSPRMSLGTARGLWFE